MSAGATLGLAKIKERIAEIRERCAVPPACERCAFWEKLTTLGICRRHAPRRGPVMWPTTQRLDWCGEFRERPTEAILSTDAESR